MTVTFADIFKNELCDHKDILAGFWRMSSSWGLFETRGKCNDCNTIFKLTRYKGFPVRYDIVK